MTKHLRWFLLGAALAVAVPAVGYPVLIPGQGAAQSAGYPSYAEDIAVTVTGTTTTAGVGNMSAGVYVITCTEASHVDQGATGVTATTSERLLPAFGPYPLKITGNGDNYLAFIRNAVSGTCIVSKDKYE